MPSDSIKSTLEHEVVNAAINHYSHWLPHHAVPCSPSCLAASFDAFLHPRCRVNESRSCRTALTSFVWKALQPTVAILIQLLIGDHVLTIPVADSPRYQSVAAPKR